MFLTCANGEKQPFTLLFNLSGKRSEKEVSYIEARIQLHLLQGAFWAISFCIWQAVCQANIIFNLVIETSITERGE